MLAFVRPLVSVVMSDAIRGLFQSERWGTGRLETYIREFSSTSSVFTRKRFLPCVDSNVIRQPTLLHEGLATLRTFKWSLSGVKSTVSLQIGFSLEALFTESQLAICTRTPSPQD